MTLPKAENGQFATDFRFARNLLDPAHIELNNFKIQQAARVLNDGGVIAYPTEGVWGIGCLPDEHDALERVIDIKGRRSDAGVILIAAAVELLDDWIAPTAEELARLRSRPGKSVTWVVTAAPGIDPLLTGGRDTLAVRITNHPLAAALSLAAGAPLVSTSANRSGKPAALTALQVRLSLGPELDLVVEGRLGDAKGPSEIRVAQSDQGLRRGD